MGGERIQRVLDSSDDEFPDIHTLVRREREPGTRRMQSTRSGGEKDAAKAGKGDTTRGSNTVRLRKLSPVSEDSLLRPWKKDASDGPPAARKSQEASEENRPERPGIGLRARKPGAFVNTALAEEDEDEFISAKEEITFVEEAASEYCASVFGEASGSEDGSSYESIRDTSRNLSPRKRNSKPRSNPKPKPTGGPLKDAKFADYPTRPDSDDVVLKHSIKDNAVSSAEKSIERSPRFSQSRSRAKPMDDLTGSFSSFGISERPGSKSSGAEVLRPDTTPRTPPKSRRTGLVSPKKISRIPSPPHRPSSDIFWSQEFVDDWNEEHSPKKQLFPETTNKSVTMASAKKVKRKTASELEARRAFEKTRHDIAEKFLRELDITITRGRIAELAASTGGVQLTWTNKLNTTAGRANWRRETVRTKGSSGESGEPAAAVKHRHFASIELAEKVIDDEDRLLNVMAHEFCHLANFMVNGLTTNPHGREFKAWAAKCSAAFGHRGIHVTTKHTYNIDFKYVWECTSCGMEFKRHSKSIHPERHRCGSCKSLLMQTKPAPRAAGKRSEYQDFMKQHMKIFKEQNPSSPQKDIMKLVAEKWSQKLKSQDQVVLQRTSSLDLVVQGLGDLVVNETS